MGGAAGSAYAAEISALQTYQKQILVILDTMVASEAAVAVTTSIGGLLGSGGGANNGLGTFPEAADLSQTYSGVMQYLMTNFSEISDLVTTMATVLGKSAQSYLETEQQLTDQFNSIVTKFQSGGQSGDFILPGGPASTTPTGTAPQTGTSASYYSATPAPSTTTTTATTVSASPQTPAPSGSIEQDNNANSSTDTSSEE
jgi:hypothetical protein